MEKSQGNSEKPPISLTIEGTAVAMIVESTATRAVASITAMRTGPRSDRKPTLFELATTSPYGRSPTVRVVTIDSGVRSLPQVRAFTATSAERKEARNIHPGIHARMSAVTNRHDGTPRDVSCPYDD